MICKGQEYATILNVTVLCVLIFIDIDGFREKINMTLAVYSPVFVECKKKFKYTQMKVLTNDLDEKNLIELIRSV